METISGRIKNIIYNNPNNGYTVAQIETDAGVISMTGTLVSAAIGEKIIASGEWYIHPKYGQQFRIVKVDIDRPDSIDEIKAFLSSGIIKGLGEKKAALLIEKFGESTLDIIENHHNLLTSISGIGSMTAEKIHSSYCELSGERNTVIALSKYDITPNAAIKLYDEYGANAVKIVENNPYRLIEDVYGFGFARADAIAMKVGIANDSPERIKAGILFFLNNITSSGHTFMFENVLINSVSHNLGVSENDVEYALNKLIISGKLIVDENYSQRRVYSSYMYERESICVDKLSELLSSCVKVRQNDIEKLIFNFEKDNGIQLDSEQKKAINMAVSSKVSIITGGPGTGKTTIIKAIIYIFSLMRKSFSLCAPTGRASKRMSEACCYEASTIHRLLEFGYNPSFENSSLADDSYMYFQRNSENPLECDVVIVDEMSMTDILLFSHLLEAFADKTRLIMVGDGNQLPPVGPGNVLNDLLKVKQIPSVSLNKIFRQSDESSIIVNAHRIKDGKYPLFDKSKQDFILYEEKNQSNIARRIIRLISNEHAGIMERFKNDEVQILTPFKKGEAGTHELNKLLQEYINPLRVGENEVKTADYVLKEGDKVMQTKNDYQAKWQNINTHEKGQGVFNGEIGVIKYINPSQETLSVLFDAEKFVNYSYKDADNLTLAYAVTIHKSQGCEFDTVIIPVFCKNPQFLTRNLIYTAITRAKRKVVLVGELSVIGMMVRNNQSPQRMSALAERLNDAIIKCCG